MWKGRGGEEMTVRIRSVAGPGHVLVVQFVGFGLG